MPYLPGNDTQSPDTGAFGPMQPAKRPLKTRLKELEKAATNFAGADMGDARTRRRAERAVFWLDHGFVRAGWTNQAEIAPGVFRSNQPGFRRLARAKAQGIDTVLSLRGDGVSAWQRLEAQYCAELGLDLHTAALRSSRAPEAADAAAWDALRVAHAIPEYGSELGPDAYILEYGFERLGGVDFRKGCYVGQEIVARMKHRQDLRRKLLRVSVDGPAPAPGTEVVDAEGKPAGTLGAVAGGEGLAHLRLDRADRPLKAGGASVAVIG